jgi:hypothetical protein
MIKNIISISLNQQILNIQPIKETLNDSETITINNGITYGNLAYNKEIDAYRINVNFQITIAELDLLIFSVEHTVGFTSENKLDEEMLSTKDFAYALFEIIEPYIRERLINSFEHTEVPTPRLPYRFWKDYNKED